MNVKSRGNCLHCWTHRLISISHFDSSGLYMYFYCESLKIKFFPLKLRKEIKYYSWVLSVIIFIIYSGIAKGNLLKNYSDHSYVRITLSIQSSPYVICRTSARPTSLWSSVAHGSIHVLVLMQFIFQDALPTSLHNA